MLDLLANFNQSDLVQRQLSGMRSVAYVRQSTGVRYDGLTMPKACEELHDWLSSESLLRSCMSYLAGGGCCWYAYAHERAIRCFVSVGSGAKEDLVAAMSARGSSDLGLSPVSALGSMSALERTG